MFWPLMVYSESANRDFHKSLEVNFFEPFSVKNALTGEHVLLFYAMLLLTLRAGNDFSFG